MPDSVVLSAPMRLWLGRTLFQDCGRDACAGFAFGVGFHVGLSVLVFPGVSIATCAPDCNSEKRFIFLLLIRRKGGMMEGMKRKNAPVRRGCKPSPPVVCSACGKPEDSPLHIKYGPDLDNPRKHHFTPNASVRVGAEAPYTARSVGRDHENG